MQHGWLDDEDPYVLERQAEPPTPLPRPVDCPYATYGSHALLYTPTSALDAVNIVRKYQNNPSVRCILFARHKQIDTLPPTILNRWANACRNLTGKIVHLYDKNAPYLCGACAHCQRDVKHLQAELIQEIEAERQQTQNFNKGLQHAFPGLPQKYFQVLHDWAFADEPGTHGIPITIKTLAARIGKSDETVYRYLRKAQKINPEVYARLEEQRDFRFHQATGGQFNGQ